MKAFENILEPLINYTCDVFTEMTPQKLIAVRLKYEIIRQAIVDLYSNNAINVSSAKEYFEGPNFLYDCECVGINSKTMLYIVNNPDKYKSKIGSYGNDLDDEIAYESFI